MRSYLLDARSRNFAGVEHDFHDTLEIDHGRIEARRFWITESIDWFADLGLWEGLRSFGMVEGQREINGETTSEVLFFLSSLPADAQNLVRAARGHWSVENSQHWTLDAAFGEDSCRVPTGNASENLARLRHIALNVLKNDTRKKRDIGGKQDNASWDHDYLSALLGFQMRLPCLTHKHPSKFQSTRLSVSAGKNLSPSALIYI